MASSSSSSYPGGYDPSATADPRFSTGAYFARGQVAGEAPAPQSAEYYRDKTQESLRKTLNTLKATDEVATKTCLQLDEQTEQIQRAQSYADTAESNLDTSEKILKSMSSWFGSLQGAFSSTLDSNEKFLEEKARAGKPNDTRTQGTTGQEQPQESSILGSFFGGSVGASASSATELFNSVFSTGGSASSDPGFTASASNPSSSSTGSNFGPSGAGLPRAPPSALGGAGNITRQLGPATGEDEDLAMMEQLVGGLKEKSQAMGQALSMHNQMLERLNDTTDRNIQKMDHNQMKMKQILR
ncbi:unnamed protein product [Amoebophrya sp. A25]|nr:unnamed protein product [Amoebophrya sp. A25]|eukprot:GSA25T00020081001.1